MTTTIQLTDQWQNVSSIRFLKLSNETGKNSGIQISVSEVEPTTKGHVIFPNEKLPLLGVKSDIWAKSNKEGETTFLTMTEENGVDKRASFVAYSLSTINVGIDPDNPSFITGMVLNGVNTDFEIDGPTGAIKNISGRDIGIMTGNFSFQPEKGEGGTTQLNLWSERSLDGVTWSQNYGSLRSIEISNSGESFKTSASFSEKLEQGEYLRFRAYSKAGGAVDFVPATDTVLSGENIIGYSAFWELSEN